MAVRLMDPVQASRKRTWASIADRAAGSSVTPERDEPGVERLVVRRGQWSKVLETRRERISRAVQGTLHVVVH